jgi:hypothetical protein
VNLIEQMDSLYERALDAIADHPRPGPATKVGFILTSRLTSDLRVCSLSAQLGYGIQALLVGATVVELVGALAYVGACPDNLCLAKRVNPAKARKAGKVTVGGVEHAAIFHRQGG